MMSWIIGAFLGGFLLFWGARWVARADAAALAANVRYLIRGLLISLAIGLIGARIPLARAFLRFFPFFFSQRAYRKARDHDSKAGHRRAASPRAAQMSVAEARRILNVGAEAGSAEITRAWRARMRRAHPDQGGSQEDAVRLNQARDVLLKRK